MSPLAQRLFKQLTLKKRDRGPDPFGYLRHYEDLHCFEVTAIHRSVANVFKHKAITDGKENPEAEAENIELIEALPLPFFLPSPATWLEYRDEGVGHFGLLLFWEAGEIHVLAAGTYDADEDVGESGFPFLTPQGRARQPEGPTIRWDVRPIHNRHGFSNLRMVALAFLLVDVINTPGIVMLQERDPHRGHARRMLQSGGFPLQAWHEVTINPDRVVREVTGGSGSPHCLNFCRAHWRRIGDGRVPVRAHWRGDPALGIARTRYLVDE